MIPGEICLTDCLHFKAKDPITQEQKAYKLLLDNRYETMQIKDYVHLLHKFCPELAGLVMRD